MAIRYDTKTWENRPTKLVWDKVKSFVGYQPGITDLSVPPIFGWCIDQLREKYGVYISITPHLQRVSKGDDEGSNLVFHFIGSIIRLNGGKITKDIKYTGNDFLTVINSCLAMAAEYLTEEKEEK